MKVTLPNPSIGTHRMMLKSIANVKDEEKGECLLFVFENTEYHYETKRRVFMGAGSGFVSFLGQLLGKELKPEDDIDLNRLIGRYYDVEITATSLGKGVWINSIRPATAA